MFKNRKFKLFALLTIALVGVAYAARSTYYRREHTFPLGQIWLLENTGVVTQLSSLKFGDNEDTPSLPTASTGSNFGVKVPFYNASPNAVAQGSVILSSTTDTSNLAYGTTGSVLSTTTWVGVADGTVASGGKGWMTVAGYALVLTTGTVFNGDLITSSNNATLNGYAGAIAGAATVLEGAVIGKAMQKQTAQGLTLIRLGN